MMARVFDGKTEGLTRDDILDNITFYWLTNTGVSSARLLGKQTGVFRTQERPNPGSRERLPRRDPTATLGLIGVHGRRGVISNSRHGRKVLRFRL
jgi:hypothetical protein